MFQKAERTKRRKMGEVIIFEELLLFSKYHFVLFCLVFYFNSLVVREYT